MLWLLFTPVVTDTIVKNTLGTVAGKILFDELAGGPSILDKAELILTDAETEGRKRGYEKAATEYERAYQFLEDEYSIAVDFLKDSRELYELRTAELGRKLKRLEREKELLQKELDARAGRIAELYDIPVSQVRACCAGGALRSGCLSDRTQVTFLALDLMYLYKKKKLETAEKEGYEEAREIYEKKLAGLRDNLRRIVAETDEMLRQYAEIYEELLDEITAVKTGIAELGALM